MESLEAQVKALLEFDYHTSYEPPRSYTIMFQLKLKLGCMNLEHRVLKVRGMCVLG